MQFKALNVVIVKIFVYYHQGLTTPNVFFLSFFFGFLEIFIKEKFLKKLGSFVEKNYYTSCLGKLNSHSIFH